MKICYPHKLRGLAFVLLFALAFAFTGCTDSTTPNTNTPPDMVTWYTETVGDIDWTIHYRSISREIISINASYTENDCSSDYWRFSAYYHGDSNLPVKHSVSLVGSPIGDNWFKIEQTEVYIMSATSPADLERVRKSYPSCTQNPETYDITLYSRLTRYEEKLLFTLPPAKDN